MNPDSPILLLRHVCYSTPDGHRLGTDVTTELDAGQILLVTGPNGSGKSTLLDIILGLRTHDSGTVQLNLPESCICYLPQMQDTQTHLPFTLRDVLQVSVNRSVDDEEITSHGLLTRRHLNLGWNNASGGEKRRALLTRTLLQEPKLIVLDEPFNHLDSESQQVMTSALHRFVAIDNNSVILSTHAGFAVAGMQHRDPDLRDSQNRDSQHGNPQSAQLPGELTIKHIAL